MDEIEKLKQTIRGYRGILEDAGVHITHADIDEWHDSRERLLAVARAASKLAYWGTPVDTETGNARVRLSVVEEIHAALAAAEDLL